MGQDRDRVPDDVEFLDFGPKPRPEDERPDVRRRRRLTRPVVWLPILLVAIVAAVVITGLVRRHPSPSAAPASRAPTEAKVTHPVGPPIAPVPPVRVTEVGHPLLGATTDWVLYGRGDGVVVRIEPARGRITRTKVPPLASDGPVSFVVGAHEALVRPLDNVPGYVVPDGRAAYQMTSKLGENGPVFPGPDANHIWAQSGPGAALIDIAIDGTHHGATIRIPADSSLAQVAPDGSGYILINATSGIYDARPDGLHRITTGSLLAAGPTGWLVTECDVRHRCATIMVDRIRGTRRTVAGAPPGGSASGVISPDGRTAALYRIDATGVASLVLLDLASGTEHAVHIQLDQTLGDPRISWSPDGRWLLAIDAYSEVDAVDPSTHRVHDLGVQLPPLSQLAVRGPN